MILNSRRCDLRLKRVAVLQSNYIPWKGYFDIIHDVDEFIFHDDLQFTKNDWRNRNQIFVNGKLNWLSIPVGTNEHRLIIDVEMKDHRWQSKHFKTIEMAYHRSKFWSRYKDFFEDVYLNRTWKFLYELNRFLIEHISREFLGITTRFSDSRDYDTHGVKHEKLLSLVKSAGTDVYVSGPAAKDYIIEKDYLDAGIKIVWKDYSHYPRYVQKSNEFTHFVSIIDLLFSVNEPSLYIWGGGRILKFVVLIKIRLAEQFSCFDEFFSFGNIFSGIKKDLDEIFPSRSAFLFTCRASFC